MKKIKSILYVEDEKKIQEELAEVLETFCETLYLADDGVQGLKEYQQYKPDIIITDIKMPFMNGIDMCQKIKEIDSDAHIIFTTAFSDVEFFQEAIELQVDGYVLKPIDLTLLDKKITSIIKSIRLEEELFEKEQMLLQQSKLASMGEMIGNIAHQWKQPLSVISLSMGNILIDSELGELKEEDTIAHAKKTITQVEYLSKTIDDFRTFFQPTEQSTVVNIKQFVDKCVDLVSASFDSNTISIIKDIDDTINSFGNPNQLSQALINILNNSKDALTEAVNIQKKLVFILSAKEDDKNNIIITIKDNAGGIPNDIIGHIFEPYFTTKHQSQGTGLGIYITHTIITRNLQGTIRVENREFEFEGEQYKGAAFIITLPLS